MPIKRSETTSCIIPFYNEGKRVNAVVKSLLRVKNLKEIICVDDGSTDGAYKLLEKFPSKVKVLRLPQNLGKTKAVKYGLDSVKDENILLLDGDLIFINIKDIEKAIEVFVNNSDIDMIILRNVNDHLVNKLIRTDVVINGQRLIRKRHLEEILKAKLGRFQLELAINYFMRRKNKKYYWLPFSFYNEYKKDKYGFREGIIRELRMFKDLFTYKGVLYYVKNLASFCWNQYPEK